MYACRCIHKHVLYACEGLEINSHCLSQSLSTSSYTHTHLLFYVCVLVWLCNRVHVWRSENSLGARSSPSTLHEPRSLLLFVTASAHGSSRASRDPNSSSGLTGKCPYPLGHLPRPSPLSWRHLPSSRCCFTHAPPRPDFTWVLRTWTQVLTLTQHTLTTEPMLQPHQ